MIFKFATAKKKSSDTRTYSTIVVRSFFFVNRLLTTGTIEEKIFQRQVMKQSLSGAVVDAKDSSKAHFTREDLKVRRFNSLSCCPLY